MTGDSGTAEPHTDVLKIKLEEGTEMKFLAALATVSILLVGCNGNGESEEQSSSGAVAERGDEQDGKEDESDEE